jgi:hypothetical protein
MGNGLSRLTALTFGAWLAWVPPSSAVHDSLPSTQQPVGSLTYILKTARRLCHVEGDQRACAVTSQAQALGNELDQARQDCVRGNQQACQAQVQVEQQITRLMEHVFEYFWDDFFRKRQ